MFGWFRRRKDDSYASKEPPIGYAHLRELFTWLDRPNPPACDHTHRETAQFLSVRGLPIESTIQWLRYNGGFCDCEVIYNVADAWGEKVGWQPNETG